MLIKRMHRGSMAHRVLNTIKKHGPSTAKAITARLAAPEGSVREALSRLTRKAVFRTELMSDGVKAYLLPTTRKNRPARTAVVTTSPNGPFVTRPGSVTSRIMELMAKQPMTSGELQAALKVREVNVSQSMARLTAAGLITRGLNSKGRVTYALKPTNQVTATNPSPQGDFTANVQVVNGQATVTISGSHTAVAPLLAVLLKK